MFAARALYREEVRLQGVKVGWRMRAILWTWVSLGARAGEFRAWLKSGEVWVRLRPVFQVHSLSLRTHSQGDLGHSGKAPSLGLALVDS